MRLSGTACDGAAVVLCVLNSIPVNTIISSCGNKDLEDATAIALVAVVLDAAVLHCLLLPGGRPDWRATDKGYEWWDSNGGHRSCDPCCRWIGEAHCNGLTAQNCALSSHALCFCQPIFAPCVRHANPNILLGVCAFQDGAWYDVAVWADAHPGGRWLLEYARGRDVTALFHAIHMRSEGIATSSLARLPRLDETHLPLPSAAGLHPSQLEEEGALQGEYVFSLNEPPETPPLPPIASPLRQELLELLQREFPSAASSKATAAHWVRTALAAIGTLACWIGWLQGSALACLVLPFVHWVLIAHTVHEATHGNLSTDPRINYWAQFTSHPICFNVFVWIPQHLLSHHQYTNDYEHDVDCHHFAPALISDAQPRISKSTSFNEGWTFVWKGFLTTLGTSVLQPLRTLLEKPTPNYSVNVTPIPAAVSKRTLLLSVLPSLLVLIYPLVAFVPHAPLLGWFLELWPW